MLKTHGTNYIEQWFQFCNIHIYQILLYMHITLYAFSKILERNIWKSVRVNLKWKDHRWILLSFYSSKSSKPFYSEYKLLFKWQITFKCNRSKGVIRLTIKNSSIDNIYNSNSIFHNSGSIKIWTKDKVWLCLVNLSLATEYTNSTNTTVRENIQANTAYHVQGAIIIYLQCVLSSVKFSS